VKISTDIFYKFLSVYYAEKNRVIYCLINHFATNNAYKQKLQKLNKRNSLVICHMPVFFIYFIKWDTHLCHPPGNKHTMR